MRKTNKVEGIANKITGAIRREEKSNAERTFVNKNGTFKSNRKFNTG